MSIVYAADGRTWITAGEAIRVVPPAVPVWEINEVKERLRIVEDSDYGTLVGTLEAATSYVEDYTGLGLVTQTWEQHWSAYPPVMRLMMRPVQEVLRIFDMSTGDSPAPQLDATTYYVAGRGSWRDYTTIGPTAGLSWPTVTGVHMEAVEAVYSVGFGDSAEDVPMMLRQAVMVLTGIWYDNRTAPDLTPIHMMLRDWRPLGVA